MLKLNRAAKIVADAFGKKGQINGAWRIVKCTSNQRSKYDKQIAFWLLGGSGLVFGMVVLGGWTRLTESGLSMVDWQLLHFYPPRTNQEWEEYFEKYKQYPEFRLKNSEITLAEFKRIYFYEHFHRVLGRIIGMYFLLPSVALTATKVIRGRLAKRIWAINGLIGFQGLLGWYMVKSGLKEEIVEQQSVPRVSPLRLTAHLGCAFLIYALTMRTGVGILRPKASHQLSLSSKRLVNVCTALVSLTALSGGMVAGLDAGLIYDTFPRMGSTMFPSELLSLTPWWKNLAHNPTTVQFIHRYMAKGTWLSILAIWCYFRRRKIDPTLQQKFNILLGMATAQASLGIATLLSNVDLQLASLHQTGSLCLLTSCLLL